MPIYFVYLKYYMLKTIAILMFFYYIFVAMEYFWLKHFKKFEHHWSK